jgi:hypothetical protein
MSVNEKEIAELNIVAYLQKERLSESFNYDAYIVYGSNQWLEVDAKVSMPRVNRTSPVFKSTDEDVIFRDKLTYRVIKYLEPLIESEKNFRAIISANGRVDVSISK